MSTLIKNLYDSDFNIWIEKTAQALKDGNFPALDLENLIDEIEAMGRSDKREIYSRLTVLIMHLLKWKYQPQKRSSSWIATINEQRRQIKLILKDSPSLKPYLRDKLADCYKDAREDTEKETGLDKNTFPADFPFSQEQTLDSDYFPE